MTRTRLSLVSLVVLAAVLCAAPLAAATPEKGHAALGGTLGLSVPLESDYQLGFTLQGTADYYFERRISGRATIGYERTRSKAFDNPSASNGYLLGSGVYNFEMESVHPYALGGIGVYTVSPAYGGSTVRFGAHVGAGADIFLTRRTAIVGEGVFHFLGSVENQKQGFFTLNAGVRYFF